MRDVASDAAKAPERKKAKWRRRLVRGSAVLAALAVLASGVLAAPRFVEALSEVRAGWT
jgi:hypothetical protein